MSPKSVNELLEDARKKIKPISPEALNEALASGKKLNLIDVREKNENIDGRIKDSMLIPRGLLEFLVGTKVPDKSSYIVVYCAKGPRSLLSADTMNTLGYTDVTYLDGGYEQWMEKGFPIEK